MRKTFWRGSKNGAGAGMRSRIGLWLTKRSEVEVAAAFNNRRSLAFTELVEGSELDRGSYSQLFGVSKRFSLTV
jgi:hypothetical protein